MFSVVIPTYNSSQKLVRAINSVLNQTFVEFEIIVVDDGSTDDTSAVIKEIIDPRLSYLIKPNGGPASARNKGIAHSQFEYICFLDADDTFQPDKLHQVSKVIAANPNIGLIFTDALYINEVNNKEILFSASTSIYDNHVYRHLLNNNFIVNSTVIIKKDVLELRGLKFDESVKLKFVEDYDLWLKFAQNNVGFFYLNEALTNYYVHENNNSKNVVRTYKSLLSIYKKHINTKPFLIIKMAILYLKILLKSFRTITE